ncbi:hypothetical protein PFLA_a4189 [Pseudoalteromonas flavipulchra NCIMB 2033 = ATCC BAA-314]|nr:hypothetical protein [Pseudoalteromonas flavipulchra NCIMB 2033 = ATCC BAA-314]
MALFPSNVMVLSFLTMITFFDLGWADFEKPYNLRNLAA